MKKREINTLGLLDVKRALTISENIYWSNSIAINLKANAESLTQSLLIPHIPYCLAENRIILVQSGCLLFRLDLIEYKAQMGDIAFIPQGSIVEIEEISTDYECQMITFVDSPNGDATNDFTVPHILQNHLVVTAHCRSLINSIFGILSSEDGHKTSSLMILQALVEYLKECSLTSTKEEPNKQKRAEQIHNKFLRLVRENYATHRDTGWYADNYASADTIFTIASAP